MLELRSKGWTICLAAVAGACGQHAAVPDAGVGVTLDASPPGAGTSAEATIGPAGGSVATADGRVRLTVPAGALGASTMITIAAGTSSVPGALGPIWEIGPSGTQFAAPVTLGLEYTDIELAGHDPNSVAVSTVVGGTWQAITMPTRDTTMRIISGQTTHLSPYALAPMSGMLPPNGPDCPAFTPVPLRAAMCVPGTVCQFLNGFQIDHVYCAQGNMGTFWEVNTLPQDQSALGCPSDPPMNGTSCSTPYQGCQWLRFPDCPVQCTCQTDNTGVATVACYSPCDCAQGGFIDRNTCNGDAQAGPCAWSVNGKTCTQYCRQGACNEYQQTCDGMNWTQFRLIGQAATTACLH
jgi:hypothetical protein